MKVIVAELEEMTSALCRDQKELGKPCQSTPMRPARDRAWRARKDNTCIDLMQDYDTCKVKKFVSYG